MSEAVVAFDRSVTRNSSRDSSFAHVRRSGGIDSRSMKKLVLLLIFGGLLALAAKKVRSV